MRARIATHERREGTLGAREERIRQTGRHDDTECVAVLRRVLRRDVSRLAADEQRDRPAIPLQCGKPVIDGGRLGHACGQLVAREIAKAEEQVVNAVDVPCRVVRCEVLQVELELGERLGIEQLAELGLPEESA